MSNQLLARSVTKNEQHGFIKIMFLNNIDAKFTHGKLTKAVKENALSERTVYHWYELFQKGRTNMQQVQGAGRPRTSRGQENVDKVKAMLDTGFTWSVREIANTIGIGKSSVQEILTKDLQLTKRYGNWVPHRLSDAQKESREEICFSNLRRYAKDQDILTRIVALDETWIPLRSGTPKHKAQFWLKPGETAPKVPADERYAPKIMMLLGVDVGGGIFYQLLQPGSTVDSEVYVNFLYTHVGNWSSQKCVSDVIILHDNARCHKTKRIREYVEENGWEVLPHPVYSPDLNPCDFNVFSPLKGRVKGRVFNDQTELERSIDEAIDYLQQRGTFNGVNKLPEIWQNIIDAEGDYL